MDCPIRGALHALLLLISCSYFRYSQETVLVYHNAEANCTSAVHFVRKQEGTGCHHPAPSNAAADTSLVTVPQTLSHTRTGDAGPLTEVLLAFVTGGEGFS